MHQWYKTLRLIAPLLPVLAILASAAVSPAAAQSIEISLGEGEDGASYTGRLIQLFLMVTVLSLAPGILVMATSFVRIVVVFSLLRSAIGLQQAPPNMVLVSLALFLTGFIMAPTMSAAWESGVSPMMAEEIDPATGIQMATAPFQEFMTRQVDPQDLAFFQDLAAQQVRPSEEPGDLEAIIVDPSTGVGPDAALEPSLPPLHIILPAYMVSELTRAFEIGFLVMMPFLVIDLAIAAILMSMGMMMLPPQVVSLSMKLIFFVLIDGWRLLSESLVQSFI